jgi:hypothetical protein
LHQSCSIPRHRHCQWCGQQTSGTSHSRCGLSQICGGSHHSVAIAGDGECLVWGRLDGFQSGLKIRRRRLRGGPLHQSCSIPRHRHCQWCGQQTSGTSHSLTERSPKSVAAPITRLPLLAMVNAWFGAVSMVSNFAEGRCTKAVQSPGIDIASGVDSKRVVRATPDVTF